MTDHEPTSPTHDDVVPVEAVPSTEPTAAPEVAAEVAAPQETTSEVAADAAPEVEAEAETDAETAVVDDDVTEPAVAAEAVVVEDEPVVEAAVVEEAIVVEEVAVVEDVTAVEVAAVEVAVVEVAAVEVAVVEETVVSADEAADAEPADPTATPSPAPGTPRPTPRPIPRPAPRPTPPSVRLVTAPAAPVPAASAAPPALTEAESAEAARWGRVDDDGTVWVREESGERVVGQYPGADATDALAFYVRRFGDLHAKVLLVEARLATDVPVKELDATLALLATELAEPAAVGDLDSLRVRLTALQAVAAERRAVAEAERAAAKAAALEARTALVEEAEKLAALDPEKVQWRPAGEQLRLLLEQWKDAQRHGPRVDRASEDALWKRFSHARSTFDRERRRYFSELEKQNADAKAVKTALAVEAEKLAGSTDWADTSAQFRDLMAKWKAAGRASRKDDDALWARFRGAQDQFFAARDAANKQTDAEFAANLEVKLRLLEQAEKLVPVRDLPAARAALRDLQERWEDAGKVPRADIQRVEGRLRAVEQAVREAEQTQWQRSNPETRARAEGALAQLTSAIAGLEADLAAAQAAGNARKVAEAQAALDARRAWLEQIERAAADSR